MERKHFLSGAALAGAALAMVGAATATYASDTSTSTTSNSLNCGPAPMPRPRPSGSPFAGSQHARQSEIESAFRHVDRIISMLQRDPNDYGGHKATALAALSQAADQLSQAVAYQQAHPSTPQSTL
jgi:hypothetical protein